MIWMQANTVVHLKGTLSSCKHFFHQTSACTSWPKSKTGFTFPKDVITSLDHLLLLSAQVSEICVVANAPQLKPIISFLNAEPRLCSTIPNPLGICLELSEVCFQFFRPNNEPFKVNHEQHCYLLFFTRGVAAAHVLDVTVLIQVLELRASKALQEGVMSLCHGGPSEGCPVPQHEEEVRDPGGLAGKREQSDGYLV